MMVTPRVEDQLQLAATATAVGCARIFVGATLTRWGVTGVLDGALLVCSELVTNAVKATGITKPNPSWGELTSLRLLTVRLVGLAGSVVIEVGDSSLREPAVRQAVPEDEGGRGLGIVEHLAVRWGCYPCRSGNVVWAELPARPQAKAAGREGPDARTLERVRDGLRGLLRGGPAGLRYRPEPGRGPRGPVAHVGPPSIMTSPVRTPGGSLRAE